MHYNKSTPKHAKQPDLLAEPLISLWIKDLVIWIRFITNPVLTPIFIFQSIY